jgi:hypothetical protein
MVDVFLAAKASVHGHCAWCGGQHVLAGWQRLACFVLKDHLSPSKYVQQQALAPRPVSTVLMPAVPFCFLMALSSALSCFAGTLDFYLLVLV